MLKYQKMFQWPLMGPQNPIVYKQTLSYTKVLQKLKITIKTGYVTDLSFYFRISFLLLS